MKAFRILLLVSLVFGLAGCYNPLSKWASAEKKVNLTQQKVQKNSDDTVNVAKSYIYGTKLSLDLDPNPNKYSQLAADFNNKSIIVLGTPALEEVNVLKSMVTNLLSTNNLLISQGQKQLSVLDKQVYELQNEKVELGSKLDKAEKRLVEVGGLNAKIAQTYQTIKNWFWRIAWTVGILFVLKLVSQFLPSPYNNIGCIVSIPLAIITRCINALMPDVKKYAKVVGEEYKSTLEQVIVSVEDAKAKIEAQNKSSGKKSEGLERLKAELNTNTDATTKVLISQTKQGLGYH